MAAPSLDGVFKAVQKENEKRYGRKRSAVARRSSRAHAVVRRRRRAGDRRERSSGTRGRGRTRTTELGSAVATCFSRRLARFAATTLGSSRRSSRRRFCFSRRAMARFRPTPSTYAASFHVRRSDAETRVRVSRRTAPSCRFGAAASSAARNSPPRSSDEARSRRAPSEPRNESGSTLYAENAEDTPGCFPEEALGARSAAAVPSALSPRARARRRRRRGGRGNGESRAATIWWSSERVSGAAAALARTRALERYVSAFGGGQGTRQRIARRPPGAAEAADARGRVSPVAEDEPPNAVRATLRTTPGPAAAAAAALLAVSVPLLASAAAAARQRASGLRRVLLVAGAPKLARWLGVVGGRCGSGSGDTAIHVLAACAAGGDALLGAGVGVTASGRVRAVLRARVRGARGGARRGAGGRGGRAQGVPRVPFWARAPATALPE